MTQTIERLKLAIPKYYERSPKDLFNNELRVDDTLISVVHTLGKFVSSSLLFQDPQRVMEELAAEPHIDTPNHNGFFDGIVVGSVYEHLNKGELRPYYLMLAEPYQYRPGAYLGGHLGGIPLDRYASAGGDKGVSIKMMRMTEYALKVAKRPLVVFPEGTFEDRQQDTGARKGAIRLATRNQVPIVTWGLGGTTGAVKRYLLSAGLLGIRTSAVIGDVFMPEERVSAEKL